MSCPTAVVRRRSRTRGFWPSWRRPLNTPNSRNLRICSNDLGIQISGGQFTESSPANAAPTAATDRFGNARTDCRVTSVTSITDDRLVEFYVQRRVIPPLPPMGTGEIEVGEQDEAGAGPEEPEAEQTAESGRRRGRAR